MEIIALQEYTDKYISLYQGQIRNIEDRLANKLIENNIVKEHTEDSAGGGGGGASEPLLLSVVWQPSEAIYSIEGQAYEKIYNAVNEGRQVFIEIDLSETGMDGMVAFSCLNYVNSEAYFSGYVKSGSTLKHYVYVVKQGYSTITENEVN